MLVGQPYCGKSTIFNEVVGYKALTTNAPGSSAEHAHGTIELDGERIEVIDLAGIYSLQLSDDAANPAVEHILQAGPEAVLIDVVDASVLARSLELTVQLAGLRRPMVIALNMMDEAERKGVRIDTARLSRLLGVPVVETVGREGEGLVELFRAGQRAAREGLVPRVLEAPVHVERVIAHLARLLEERQTPTPWHSRFVAVKLIEKDPCVRRVLNPLLTPADQAAIEDALGELEKAWQQPSEFVMSSVRHGMAFDLFEAVARVETPRRRDVQHRIDALLMHPLLGYVFLGAILSTTFSAVFSIGGAVEPHLLGVFDALAAGIAARLGADTLSFALVRGAVQGVGGGIAIVIPYLLPFFVALAFLEDTGYLPRIAYLIDNLMHRIGLHGMSVVPIVMGYGCSVPGILATRILKSKRDRLITATLITLIPCSARMTIIFGLVGFFISMKAAVFIYFLNLLLVALTGRVLSALLPEVSPGLLMEIPRYHVPALGPLARKTWFRLKEFVVIAWPILILGSVALQAIDHFGLADPINRSLAPFTAGVLGFPAAVGTTLLFGIMRKELALVLLFAAVGTNDVLSVMTEAQVFTYAFFVTFYIPCLATYAALGRELGWRSATLVSLGTLAIVSAIGVLLRFTVPAFLG